MSLEAVIQENTATMRELIAKLSQGAALPGVDKPTASAAVPAKADKPASTKPAAVKPVTPAVQPAPAANALTYKDAEKAVLDLAKTKGRDAAVKLLAGFSAADGKPCTNLKQVPESAWSALVDGSKKLQAAA